MAIALIFLRQPNICGAGPTCTVTRAAPAQPGPPPQLSGRAGLLRLRQDGGQQVVQAALGLDLLYVGRDDHGARLAQPHRLGHLPTRKESHA